MAAAICCGDPVGAAGALADFAACCCCAFLAAASSAARRAAARRLASRRAAARRASATSRCCSRTVWRIFTRASCRMVSLALTTVAVSGRDGAALLAGAFGAAAATPEATAMVATAVVPAIATVILDGLRLFRGLR